MLLIDFVAKYENIEPIHGSLQQEKFEKRVVHSMIKSKIVELETLSGWYSAKQLVEDLGWDKILA